MGIYMHMHWGGGGGDLSCRLENVQKGRCFFFFLHMVVLSSMITEAKEGRHRPGRDAHNVVFEAESVEVDYRDSTGESIKMKSST